MTKTKATSTITMALIMLLTLIMVIVLGGCAPKHNDIATLDKVKSITLDMSKDQVLEIMGDPLAYDSLEVDWDTHGYDLLVYSPDDLAILEWYKTRNKKDRRQNLPGFTSNLHWHNKTWERKYYTGTSTTKTAPISYILMNIKFKDFKIVSIRCEQYTQAVTGGAIVYTLGESEVK